ncbi:TetR/AcrR family transcriptional regulator [Pusillimonas sp. ANT_WB101]|uniref:TetR/AcrR family transcriptional regulator n=1 Tax=Pusillimonas sp. ANT_WB101 TaxID=2597356 RepID=UPI0011EF7EAC|nr:TetR/AcrR family transcriptional regulator [Pusillimonas sp. ANT_WB101]KAA0892863.1 TetR/AcrR family transcriptional regulator [Pusillimonas sp. ANT_WB101]
MPIPTSSKKRRRDAELENAIIEVAWAELLKRGYAGLTMESVAAAASTSRPVLARRWNGKATLAVAAVSHQLAIKPINVPERGNVRTELLDYLDQVSDLAPIINIIFSMLSDTSFRESYPSAPELRHRFIAGRADSLKLILHRAAKRDEIDTEKLIPAIESLLSDLIGHYILINGKAPPKTLRVTWVDALLLPLVRSR